MGELNTFFVSELYRAIVRDGHPLNFQHHIILLQHIYGWRHGVYLEHQTT